MVGKEKAKERAAVEVRRARAVAEAVVAKAKERAKVAAEVRVATLSGGTEGHPWCRADRRA